MNVPSPVIVNPPVFTGRRSGPLAELHEQLLAEGYFPGTPTNLRLDTHSTDQEAQPPAVRWSNYDGITRKCRGIAMAGGCRGRSVRRAEDRDTNSTRCFGPKGIARGVDITQGRAHDAAPENQPSQSLNLPGRLHPHEKRVAGQPEPRAPAPAYHSFAVASLIW